MFPLISQYLLIKKRRNLTVAVPHFEALALPVEVEQQHAEPTLMYIIFTLIPPGISGNH